MRLLKTLSLIALFWVLGCSTPVSESRSPGWPAVRAQQLARTPYCELCGTTKKLQAHHIIPFDVDPSLELVLTNLCTLCRTGGSGCHYYAGHGGRSWSYENTNLVHILKYQTGKQLWQARNEAKWKAK